MKLFPPLVFFLILAPLVSSSSLGVYPARIYFDDNQQENVIKILTKNDYAVKSDLDIFNFQKEKDSLKVFLKAGTLPKGTYQAYIIIQENTEKLSPAVAVKAFVNITREPEQQMVNLENQVTSNAVRKQPIDIDLVYLYALALVMIVAAGLMLIKYIPKNIFLRRKCRRH